MHKAKEKKDLVVHYEQYDSIHLKILVQLKINYEQYDSIHLKILDLVVYLKILVHYEQYDSIQLIVKTKMLQ